MIEILNRDLLSLNLNPICAHNIHFDSSKIISERLKEKPKPSSRVVISSAVNLVE